MNAKLNDELRLNHIYDAITNIEMFIEGISISNFLKNELVSSAVIKNLK